MDKDDLKEAEKVLENESSDDSFKNKEVHKEAMETGEESIEGVLSPTARQVVTCRGSLKEDES